MKSAPAGTAASGSGLGPGAAGFVLGILKAYTTRVGSGPFPSEQDNAVGERLGTRGHEFGTVTGRKRRCGWFDAVLAAQLDGRRLDYLPPHPQDQLRVRPVYETIEGWAGSTAGARSWAELPAPAIKYIRRVEELIRCPVALVSTSPEREDTILVRDPFAD